MKPKIAHGNVNPAINAHTNAVGSVVGSATLQEFGGADVLNNRGGGAVGDTVRVFVFQKPPSPCPKRYPFLGKNGMQHKKLVAYGCTLGLSTLAKVVC